MKNTIVKIFAISVFIFSAVFSFPQPSQAVNFTCPVQDIADTGCRGPKNCLYRNPDSNESFIQCVPQPDGSGIPVVINCASSLVWNDSEKQCDDRAVIDMQIRDSELGYD